MHMYPLYCKCACMLFVHVRALTCVRVLVCPEFRRPSVQTDVWIHEQESRSFNSDNRRGYRKGMRVFFYIFFQWHAVISFVRPTKDLKSLSLVCIIENWLTACWLVFLLFFFLRDNYHLFVIDFKVFINDHCCVFVRLQRPPGPR